MAAGRYDAYRIPSHNTHLFDAYDLWNSALNALSSDFANISVVQASNVVTDEEHRFITDSERGTWNESASVPYVDEQIAAVAVSGIPRLSSFSFLISNSTEGRTIFQVPMDEYDSSTDTLLVWNAGNFMTHGYTITNTVRDGQQHVTSRGYITLGVGITSGTEIFMIVLKNVPVSTSGAVSGACIAVGTLAANRLINSGTDVFAPQGFGLGGLAKSLGILTSVNTLYDTGFYSFSLNSPVGLLPAGTYVMNVTRLSAYSCIQEVTCVGSDSLSFIRTCISGSLWYEKSVGADISIGPNPPSNPVAFRTMWVDTTNKEWKYWDGEVWQGNSAVLA